MRIQILIERLQCARHCLRPWNATTAEYCPLEMRLVWTPGYSTWDASHCAWHSGSDVVALGDSIHDNDCCLGRLLTCCVPGMHFRHIISVIFVRALGVKYYYHHFTGEKLRFRGVKLHRVTQVTRGGRKVGGREWTCTEYLLGVRPCGGTRRWQEATHVADDDTILVMISTIPEAYKRVIRTQKSEEFALQEGTREGFAVASMFEWGFEEWEEKKCG